MAQKKLNINPWKKEKDLLTRARVFHFSRAINFFRKNTLNIEINREDEHLEKTYFYCPPFCRSLDKETKIKFNEGAKRISAKAKVDSIV